MLMYSIENQPYLVVNEALALYLRRVDQRGAGIAAIGQNALDSFLADPMLIVKTIRAGIPFGLFEKLRSILTFTDSDWASYLGLSLKSLQRYRANADHIFKPMHSEKIIALTEVAHRGREVFGSQEKFDSWFHTPLMVFANQKPKDFVNDSYGKEMVIDELNRIDHGVFA